MVELLGAHRSGNILELLYRFIAHLFTFSVKYDHIVHLAFEISIKKVRFRGVQHGIINLN